jgi:hypothetical protein
MKQLVVAFLAASAAIVAAPLRAQTTDGPAPNAVQGRGTVAGDGLVDGKGVVRGEGSATGKGVAVYRNDNGQLRVKKGQGSVEGRGVVIGKGAATGSGRAAGAGEASGSGRAKPRSGG